MGEDRTSVLAAAERKRMHVMAVNAAFQDAYLRLHLVVLPSGRVAAVAVPPRPSASL